MSTDLQHFISTSILTSTHEHTEFESFYVAQPPDVLVNLFENYFVHDLVTAGASTQSVKSLLDTGNPDIRSRFSAIERAWHQAKRTGYGEGVSIIAQELYGLDHLSADGLERAQAASGEWGEPGERLRLMRDVARLDHVQIDTNTRPLPTEMAGQDFFHYDLNLFEFCSGKLDLASVQGETGIEIATLDDLRAALVDIFERSARYAVAIKSQHAYSRTLEWHERVDEDARTALDQLRAGKTLGEVDRLCLGDWCIARIAELAERYNLPFKMHTGYYAQNGFMRVDYIKSGNLAALLARYPATRFVLMHIAYPYSDELIALAKHFPNVAIDMCWGWSINPLHASDFLRRFLHAVPINKLFVFGGDSNLPAATLAYSIQTRRWLTRTLEAEIEAGLLSESDGLDIAEQLMMTNAAEFFDIEAKKSLLLAAMPNERVAGSTALRLTDRVFEQPAVSVKNSGKI